MQERSRYNILEQKKRREREKLGLGNLVATQTRLPPEDERVIKDMLYEKKAPVRLSNGRLRITNLSPPKQRVEPKENPYDQEERSVYYRKFRQNQLWNSNEGPPTKHVGVSRNTSSLASSASSPRLALPPLLRKNEQYL